MLLSFQLCLVEISTTHLGQGGYLIWFAFSLYVGEVYPNSLVTAFAGAFVFGMIAHLGAPLHRFSTSTADLIIAGAVMPFVPGIALTNAVRDIMTNQ